MYNRFCDPHPTHQWNGKFLGTRKVIQGEKKKYQCEWAYTIPKQCFAFGPERFKSSVDGSITMYINDANKRMDKNECEEVC